jgi:hypothetical protein
MPISQKSICLALTSTLTTTLLTAGASETIRITHINVCASTTAGTITLTKTDTSASVTANIFNAKPIAANGNQEYFDTVLEANDVLKGGFTTATGSTIIIDYMVET